MERTFPNPPNSCAIKLLDVDSWIHASHLKRAPTPERSTETASDRRLEPHQCDQDKKLTAGVDSFPKSQDQANDTHISTSLFQSLWD